MIAVAAPSAFTAVSLSLLTTATSTFLIAVLTADLIDLLRSAFVLLTRILFFADLMLESHMPIAVSHGEGRAEFRDAAHLAQVEASGLVAVRYLDNYGKVTERYPFNPNGSPNGITGLTTTDGRVTIMMPHPERTMRACANSWHPDDWEEASPWLRAFRNARKALG